MKRELKAQIIEQLTEKISGATNFYLTDTSSITVEDINKFRGHCYDKGVSMQVVKNTLLTKALEPLIASGNELYKELLPSLKGPTSLLISDNPKAPAEIIKEFRGEKERPILKAAYIDSSVYIGDDQLEGLSKIKSKEELIGEIIGLLESPAKNVISSLKSAGSTLSGLMKALEERAAS